MAETYVFVGTYTQPILFGTGQILQGKGKGIYALKFDRASGTLHEAAVFEHIDNPSYLCFNREGNRLYAVNELKQFAGKAQGALSAFAVDKQEMRLKLLSQHGTGGTDPCHVVLDSTDSYVFVSNFMSGSVAVFPALQNGTGPCSQFIQHEGSSVNKARQSGPHAHSLVFDKACRYAFVPDLGIDKLVGYPWENGKLETAKRADFSTVPGDGPRHCEFTPDGKTCYLINEIASSISALHYDGNGGFSLLGTVPTVAADYAGSNTCADIHLSPDGQFLYGSNRGHNSIVVYRVLDDGRLRFVDCQPCGGEIPRNFAISPDGRFLVVANQDTDNLVVFARDKVTGLLKQLSSCTVPTPVCVKFVQF